MLIPPIKMYGSTLWSGTHSCFTFDFFIVCGFANFTAYKSTLALCFFIMRAHISLIELTIYIPIYAKYTHNNHTYILSHPFMNNSTILPIKNYCSRPYTRSVSLQTKTLQFPFIYWPCISLNMHNLDFYIAPFNVGLYRDT